MGIENLENLLQKDGKEKVIELLSTGKIQIAEKINAHRVSFLKDKLNNIEFYTKRKGSPIRTIDRVISDLYDPFIKHIISKKDIIPEGYYNLYFFAYDLDVAYTKKPKNNLLLTDAQLTDNSNKYTLSDVASLLDVTLQTELFYGKMLKRKHIAPIISYIDNGGILPSIMSTVFGKSALTLSKNDSDIIEGYVFKIKDKLYKLEDNRFKRNTFPKVNTSSYEMLVNELVVYTSTFDFTKVKLEMNNYDLRYANFVFTLFNNLINDYENVEDILVNPPSFINKTGSLGKKYIGSETLKNIKDVRYEYLLKIMLSLFNNKLEKRGLINDDTVELHTKVYAKIKDYIKVKNKVFDFNEFKKFSN